MEIAIENLTYKQVKTNFIGKEITKQVLAARNLAWDISQSADPNDYFVLNFNYFTCAYGETYNHFVILNKKFWDQVDSEWSSKDFNAWEQNQSIYDISVIKDLSTDSKFKKLVLMKKVKTNN